MSKYEYEYDATFFDFVGVSSGKSATQFLIALDFGFDPNSVLDVGCGRGVWLSAWKKLGVKEVLGLDGTYINKSSLFIDAEEFIATDISQPINLGKRFDLVQCLEVAEHLSSDASDTLISNLVNHSNIVLFSSASPGQGGEHHVNERPISYWAAKFKSAEYDAFDYPRSVVQRHKDIEPWYRFNTVMYANAEGQLRLSKAVKETFVPNVDAFRDYAPLWWQLRCRTIQILPYGLVNYLARIKHRIMT